jgi:hypothetical protein
MSNINTTGLDTNFPTPGVNNPSQGFRTNFTNIKTNLDAAGAEISDIQSKAIFKTALANTTLNNDMAGSLISNATIQNFRHKTLGNVGGGLEIGVNTANVLIDVSKGDIQYYTIGPNANVSLTFAGWAPTGNVSSVTLVLDYADPTRSSYSYITLPTSLSSKTSATIENFSSSNNKVNAPTGVTQLQYTFSSGDCGSTIDIYELNRSRISTQILFYTGSVTTDIIKSKVGRPGDAPGTMIADSAYLYICTGYYDGSTSIWKAIPIGNFPIQ